MRPQVGSVVGADDSPRPQASATAPAATALRANPWRTSASACAAFSANARIAPTTRSAVRAGVEHLARRTERLRKRIDALMNDTQNP